MTKNTYVKGRNRKEVEAPSGYTFTIRQIPTRVYSKLTKISKKRKKLNEKISEDEVPEDIIELMDVVLTSCVVKPRITLDPSDTDALHIDDVLVEDGVFLIDAVYEYTGVNKEAMEEIDEFREE